MLFFSTNQFIFIYSCFDPFYEGREIYFNLPLGGKVLLICLHVITLLPSIVYAIYCLVRKTRGSLLEVSNFLFILKFYILEVKTLYNELLKNIIIQRLKTAVKPTKDWMPIWDISELLVGPMPDYIKSEQEELKFKLILQRRKSSIISNSSEVYLLLHFLIKLNFFPIL